MRFRSSLAASLVLTALGAAPAPDELRLVPLEGCVFERTFERVMEQEAETASDQMPHSSSSIWRSTLVVTDEVLSVEDGRITGLARTFDEASNEHEGSFEFGEESHDNSRSAACDLEGGTVLFAWDEEDEEYLRSSEDTGDDEVLEALVFDYDFTLLLPDDDAEEGDEWELELDSFRAALDPWQGLPWDWGRESGGAEDDDGSEPDIDRREDGELIATYGGEQELDGQALMLVYLEGELEIETTAGPSSTGEDGEFSMRVELFETRTMEGEVLWNLGAGSLHSLEFIIESSTASTTEFTSRFEGQEFSSEITSESEWVSTFTASSVRVE